MSLEPDLAPELTWRTSSYSGGQGGDCVEVAAGCAGQVAVRDSKDRAGAVLSFSPGVWGAFVGSVQSDSQLPAVL